VNENNMAVYHAELEYTTTLLVRFELDDDLEPTDEDALEAASYVDNHRDCLISEEKVNFIEKDELCV
jgi:hypothetical protein